MPTMIEIYQHHAVEYDELVRAEDYQANLGRHLESIVAWDGRTVVEAGIGTGRVTSLVVDRVSDVQAFDRSAHMIEQARRNLSVHSTRIHYTVADHLSIPRHARRGDIFIEGWSFGHYIVEQAGRVDLAAGELERMMHGVVHPGGTLIVIETLGTCVDAPGAPNESLRRYYHLLEGQYAYRHAVVRTDYRFPSVGEAARIMGFFFGDDMRNRVLAAGSAIVPEYTGVWWKSVGGSL